MLISTKQLSVSYDRSKHLILKNIEFEILENRCTLLIGKSGSGKTTLLRCLSKQHSWPIQGITYHRDLKIGFVSQTLDLFPHMSAWENCIHPQRHVLKKTRKQAEENAAPLWHLMGLEGLEHKYPSQLSGGQKQRVAILRMLVMDVDILFFDEPTSALDPQSTLQFKSILDMLRQRKITIVISTHDMEFARYFLDRVYLLEAGLIRESFDAQKAPLDSRSQIYQYVHGEGAPSGI